MPSLKRRVPGSSCVTIFGGQESTFSTENVALSNFVNILSISGREKREATEYGNSLTHSATGQETNNTVLACVGSSLPLYAFLLAHNPEQLQYGVGDGYLNN